MDYGLWIMDYGLSAESIPSIIIIIRDPEEPQESNRYIDFISIHIQDMTPPFHIHRISFIY